MTKTQLTKRLAAIQGDLQAPLDALTGLAGDIEEHIDGKSEAWQHGDAGCVWFTLMEQCHDLAGEIEGNFPDSSEI